MIPVIVHDDGTACQHPGRPAWPAGQPHPECPAGQPVTRALIGRQYADVGDAVRAAQQAAAAFTAAMAPLVSAVTRLAGALGGDPQLWSSAFDASAGCRADAGDPCGDPRPPLQVPARQLPPGMPDSRRPPG